MFKYLIIADDLVKKIQSSQLLPGQQLPAVRKLADQYSCSKQTVTQALKKLELEHFIYAKEKSGYFVVQKQLEKFNTLDTVYDFSSSSPNRQLFPINDFQHCFNRAIDTYQKELFLYGTAQGLPELIKAIKVQLENTQVFADPEYMYITSGIQQALNILCQMPFPNNKTAILIEEPSYSLLIELLKVYHLPVFSLQRTAKALDFDELERLFKEESIKFFYTTPRFHNPLGISYTKQEKLMLIQLARKYDVYLLEDDYLADFDLDNKNDSVFSNDIYNKTIYLKSFSKIIFPGLRIGVVILPPALKTTFSQYKKCADIDSSMFSQGALEIYINSGMYEYHLKNVRNAYFEKATAFNRSVQQHPLAKAIDITPPLAMKTHLLLPQVIQIDSLIKSLKNKDVLLKKADSNYLSLPKSKRENILLIELATIDLSMIHSGATLLMDEIQKQIILKTRIN